MKGHNTCKTRKQKVLTIGGGLTLPPEEQYKKHLFEHVTLNQRVLLKYSVAQCGLNDNDFHNVPVSE